MNTETSKSEYRPSTEPRPTDRPGILRLRELLNAMEILLTFALEHIEDGQRGGENIELELYNAEVNIASCFDLLHDCTGLANLME